MENSKLKHIFGVLILSFILYSCVREEVDHTKMVVEGWIDAGKHPIVMLHTSYSLSLSEPDSTTLLDILKQHHVKIITSSDAHKPRDVGMFIDKI